MTTAKNIFDKKSDFSYGFKIIRRACENLLELLTDDDKLDKPLITNTIIRAMIKEIASPSLSII